jgi:hypothetical protein
MLNLIDFKTDESGDIIIDGDILPENDLVVSTIKCAERRVSARYDDFSLLNVGAGLERYLYDKINTGTKLSIAQEIRQSLNYNSLLGSGEYKLNILESEDKISVLLALVSPFLGNTYSFKITINQENQRSYN